ncbi:LysM peptidoglycan-binding domain-containing protein [Thiorhodococcus fuscus]|uniref:LysM peptidoglycan-binding domain-containing protein n=1 Tax=Thiorhodococcus fuscus TaxID=527200 RepID=A0ABW4Y6Y4_9GAMM
MQPTPRLATPTLALMIAGILVLTAPALVFTAEPMSQAANEPPPGNLEQLDHFQHQLEELKRRVQGMEGKLRESATARKGADQARMEAERRLAEKSQEVEHQRNETQRLQGEMIALERQIEEKDAEIARLHMDRLDLQSERDKLKDTLTEHEAQIARLDDELHTSTKAHAELESRLAELQNQIPTSQGGTLTPEAARESAAEAFAVLQEARQNPSTPPDPATSDRIQAAEDELQRRQFTLAAALSAQGVYRVRSNDTLAQISSRFYGSGNQWHTLFEANHHLLEDPDHLAPGMSLVIP